MAQLKLPRVDPDAFRDLLRDVDLSRLGDLGDELRRVDLAEGIRHLDVDGLRRLADSIDRPDVDFGELRDSPVVRRILRALGREPRKRNLWSSVSAPPFGTAVVAGGVIVIAGAALGGVLAWLYQPGHGERRRTVLRRRLRHLEHRVRRLISPG